MDNHKLWQCIRLPWPPTVNTIKAALVIKGRARLILSKKGRDYFDEVRALSLLEKFPKFGDKRLQVEIHCFAGDRRKRDLGNLDKVLIDSLQKAGVFDDDSQIDDQRFIRGKNCVAKKGNVIVLIREIPADFLAPECSCKDCLVDESGGPLYIEDDGLMLHVEQCMEDEDDVFKEADQ